MRGFLDDDYAWHDRKKRERAQRFQQQSKVCQRCKATHLAWKMVGGRWVLVDDLTRKIHVCDTAGVVDEFDVIKEPK